MAWSSSPSQARAVLLAGLVLLSATAAPAEVGSEHGPRAVVEQFHRGLVELAAGSDDDVGVRAAALEPLVKASHDLSYIARFTLRRQWPQLSEAQRADFVRAFSTLSVMTYAARFGSVSPTTFSIHGSVPASRGRVQVEAAINPTDAAPIALNYLLHNRDGQWRIINIIADGVSDLALKRAEYQRVFEQQSFAGLLAHLEELTVALRGGAA